MQSYNELINVVKCCELLALLQDWPIANNVTHYSDATIVKMQFSSAIRRFHRNAPVLGTFAAGVRHSDDDKHVLELRPNVLRREWLGTRLLENDGHDIIADMTFPQQLKHTSGHYNVTVQRLQIILEHKLTLISAQTCCLLFGVNGNIVDT